MNLSMPCGVARALVPLQLEEVVEDPHYLFPQDDERAQHGGYVYGDGEGEVLLAVEAEEGGADGQMAAAADGQILGESLQETEEKGFNPSHFLSLG